MEGMKIDLGDEELKLIVEALEHYYGLNARSATRRQPLSGVGGPAEGECFNAEEGALRDAGEGYDAVSHPAESSVDYDFATLRRTFAATPSKPRPSRARLDGSGTVV